MKRLYDELGKDSTEYNPKCQNPITTLDLNACSVENTEIAFGEVQMYLNAALQRHGSERSVKRALKDSQEAWENYREVYCQSVYEHWKSGSIRTMKYLDCVQRLSKMRSLSIWEEFLTFVDSTPPILPRPSIWAKLFRFDI